VVGLGDSVKMAQKHAYETVDEIAFEGAQFRRDIGWRAIKRPA
jgi:phosphoribosylamine--glycine ligase